MPVSRRAFVAGLAATPLLTSVSVAAQAATTELSPDRFDPWLEIDAAALRKNVAVVSGLANKRPILAVIKNNAYGKDLGRPRRGHRHGHLYRSRCSEGLDNKLEA